MTIEQSDRRCLVSLLLLCVVYTFPWLPALEYFRHTEADRTLIGWEMWQRGNWIVPHLLGDLYITKPPLFYDALAIVFGIVGAPYEWAARAVSAAAFVALIVLHMLFLRAIGVSRPVALWGTAMLAFSGPLYIASIEAEIDLMFTLWCTAALYAFYLGGERSSRPLIITGYCAAALAFLTKGPQAALFSALAVIGLFMRSRSWEPLGRHLQGFLIAAAIVSIWLLLLLSHVPIADVQAVFDREILGRFSADPMAGDRQRGALFYLQPLLLSTLPWSLGLFGFLRGRHVGALPRQLLSFTLWVVIASTVILSLASGKSNRYLLPLLPLTSLVFLEGLTRLRPALWEIRRPFAWVLLVVLLLRVPYAYVYAPYRNESLSVKPTAQAIAGTLAPDEPLYILEMFERWIPYYLVRDGRSVLRLTPRIAAEWNETQRDGFAYVLLSPEELWQLTPLGSDASTTQIFPTPKKTFHLVRIQKRSAHRLALQAIFPTVMTASRDR